MKHLKKWELSLIIGFFAALLAGGIASAQTPLSNKVLRLHVIAASDSAEEQALKLEVRDIVISALEAPLDGISDRREAEAVVGALLPELCDKINLFLAEKGSGHTARAELARCDFPTRDYGAFALPAGSYMALRVIIGPGEGQNWWCVVFPPLCTAAAVGQVREAGRGRAFGR